MMNAQERMDVSVSLQGKYVHIEEVNILIVKYCEGLTVDNFYVEKSCDKVQCPFNDGSMCNSGIGCMYYDVDFLNSTVGNQTGEVTNDTFKSFIE
jgi:hypothetical protein